jgi:hypothetical protein
VCRDFLTSAYIVAADREPCCEGQAELTELAVTRTLHPLQLTVHDIPTRNNGAEQDLKNAATTACANRRRAVHFQRLMAALLHVGVTLGEGSNFRTLNSKEPL